VWPQIVGQHLKQPLAGACAALRAARHVAVALPLLITVSSTSPSLARRGADGVEPLNGVSMTGARCSPFAVLVFLANLAGSLGRSTDDSEIPTDPWTGSPSSGRPIPAAVAIASPTRSSTARRRARRELGRPCGLISAQPDHRTCTARSDVGILRQPGAAGVARRASRSGS